MIRFQGWKLLRRVSQGQRRSSLILVCWARVGILGLGIFLSIAASAQTGGAADFLSIAETEKLVRANYFEGMPEAEASRIGPAGATRLIQMLRDPTERASQAQVLLALGLCGSPDAMEAIDEWIAQPREGEIDRDTFKAWQALPFALGHLARFDRRALGPLENWMNADAPAWTFRHHKGARLRRLARRSAAMSLGQTGLPEARRALDRVRHDQSDAEFEADLREARALHLESARSLTGARP